MKDANSLINVAKFHKTFGHPIEKKPIIPSKNRCDLRISLLKEELIELTNSIKNRDLIEIADALCDLQYVLSGAVLEFGLGNKFHLLFKEVQRSNMSKACNTIKEAKNTVKHYSEKGIDCSFKKKEGKYLIYRNSDNKIMKSIYYSPANLNAVLKL